MIENFNDYLLTSELTRLKWIKSTYEKLSQKNIDELKNLNSFLKIKYATEEKKLTNNLYDVILPAYYDLLEFHEIAILKNDPYGPNDPRWSETKQTHYLRINFNNIKKNDKNYDPRILLFRQISYFCSSPYYSPSIDESFDEWILNTHISHKSGWNQFNDLMSKYEKSFFGKKTYLRLRSLLSQRLLSEVKIISDLEPIYIEAAKSNAILRKFIKDEEIFYEKYGHIPDLNKIISAVIDGIPLKTLLTNESYYT